MKYENIKLKFDITSIPSEGISIESGKTALEFTVDKNVISFNIYYDFNEKPLKLSANINLGDKVELVLMTHRIELYVNGFLKDEEWPAGNRLFGINSTIDSVFNITKEYYEPAQEAIPGNVASFENAEGWHPDENVFVGDCMPYVDEGRYHVLYLKDRHHHTSKWSLGAHQWEHISTADFNKWTVHPMAIEITESYEGSICTGSWIKRNGKHFLYYTVRMADGSPAPICRSVSDDGYHFIKDINFSFKLSDKYLGETARDPKIIEGDDGMYHMFLTTTLVKENKGCLAHLVSENLDTWSECEKPIYISDNEIEPECPDYIRYNGNYYLIYSLDTKAHYLVSDRPFDGWRVPENPIIPCSSVPKGAIWENKIVFTGFKRIDGYAGSMTFKKATCKDNGELIFT